MLRGNAVVRLLGCEAVNVSSEKVVSSIVEIVATKRTTRAVRALEPPEEANAMKGVATCPTSFVGSLHICANDAVTNSTFTLTFQSALDIAPECDEPFNDTPGTEDDNLESP